MFFSQDYFGLYIWPWLDQLQPISHSELTWPSKTFLVDLIGLLLEQHVQKNNLLILYP